MCAHLYLSPCAELSGSASPLTECSLWHERQTTHAHIHAHTPHRHTHTHFHTTWTLGQNAKELEECDPVTLAYRLPHGDRTLGWCASEEEARIAPVSGNGRQTLFVNHGHMTHTESAVHMYMHRCTGGRNTCTHVQRLGGGQWWVTWRGCSVWDQYVCFLWYNTGLTLQPHIFLLS